MRKLTPEKLRKIRLRLQGKSDLFLYCPFCQWKTGKRSPSRTIEASYMVLDGHISDEHPDQADFIFWDKMLQKYGSEDEMPEDLREMFRDAHKKPLDKRGK